MERYKYFKFKVKIVITLLSIFVLGTFAIVYMSNRNAGSGAIWAIMGLLLFALVIFFSTWSWPVVKDTGLEIRWLFLPFINRFYRYEDIKHIVFRPDARYAFVMTIVKSNGRRGFLGALDCLPYDKIQGFMDDLRSHGIAIDDRMKYGDIF